MPVFVMITMVTMSWIRTMNTTVNGEQEVMECAKMGEQ